MVLSHLADPLEDRLIIALLGPNSFLGIVDVSGGTMLLILASSSHGVNSLSLDTERKRHIGRPCAVQAGAPTLCCREEAGQAPEALHLSAQGRKGASKRLRSGLNMYHQMSDRGWE
jgi:hypothetical protein